MSELRKNAFSSEDEFQKIYEECLENEPQASEAVRNGYQEMSEKFDEYLVAVREGSFRYGYQCGYEAALKGGVAV